MRFLYPFTFFKILYHNVLAAMLPMQPLNSVVVLTVWLLKWHTPLKLPAIKKLSTNFLHEEKHVHKMLLALQKPNIVFKMSKSLPNAKHWILRNPWNWNFWLLVCLPAYLPTYLITFKKLEVKGCNTWSTNFATILNSPKRCVFSGSKVCLPSVPYYSMITVIFFFMYQNLFFFFQVNTFCIRHHILLF